MSRDQKRQARGLVELFLDERLRNANEPPGVREAVIDKVADNLETIQTRCGEQIGQLRSPSSTRIPDAYFNDEEETENALQQAGAGIRTALATEGLLAGDARAQESTYSRVLAPSARWATLAEASRVPRPSTRHPKLLWSLTPVAWHEKEGAWPPPDAIALQTTGQLSSGDVQPVSVTERPFNDWVQLAMFEHQRTFATRYPEAPRRQVIIATGLEVTDGPPPVDSFPLSEHRPNLWVARHDRLDPGRTDVVAAAMLDDFQGPLAAMVSYRGQLGAPRHHRGAGLHPFALSPRKEIAAYLRLRPEQPAVRHYLVDDQGPALVGRLWRGFLIHDGHYTPLEPAVHGADLIIRPDLYQRVSDAVGIERLRTGISVHHYEGDENDLDD